ncbi:MAG TPA: glycosyltransferase family 25 protein [Solirubrobacteraceae bacterium]|jgi:hypothetical protein|nr:glycosyltransferase family 25 protein [Solirubrobacteraceae bacterium]
MQPRAYVVHISWATARRQRLEPQLQRSGLEYEFVEGIDGRKLTDAERDVFLDADAMARYPQWLTPAVLGATLGHKCAYDALCDAGDDVALVLENDAELPGVGFGNLISELAQQITGREVMMLNFRSLEPIKLRRTGAVQCAGHQILEAVHPERLVSACAYLLRRETAAAMSEAILPARWAPDSWDQYLECGAVSRIKCVLPQPVREDIGTRSLARHGSDVAGLERLQQSTILPLQIARIVNRYRIRHRMTRVKLVD